MLPLKFPVVPGVNVTLITHEAPLPKVAPQVLAEIAKYVGFVPVIEIEEIENVAVPEFRSVTETAVDVVPTPWFPNDTDVGDKLTAP
jgi:hypothetical protein